MRVYCTVSGLPDERADDVLRQVGLADAGHRKTGGYSLGMRQRLALAAALLGDPGVMVLDEPANGLDPEGIAWMRQLLRGLADRGKAILVSSHLLAELQQLVDEVVILNRGRLVHQGTLEELSGSRQPVTLVRTPAVDELVDALTSVNHNGTHIERTAPESLAVVGMTAADIGHAAWQARIELHELTSQHSGLEELFFTLTNTQTEETPSA